MQELTTPFLGGILIGTSSLLMLLLLGRITGISGIFGSILIGEPDSSWRWLFLAGMLAGPFLAVSITQQVAPAPSEAGWPIIMIAGLLVGFGTRYAGGCTSGHGVCGIGRLSPRSIAATPTFIVWGMLTVYLVRVITGGVG